jgi:hypothetical protein
MTNMTPGRDSAGLGFVLDFLRVLWSVEHQLKSASKRMERRLGITGPQRLVLRRSGRPEIVAPGASWTVDREGRAVKTPRGRVRGDGAS